MSMIDGVTGIVAGTASTALFAVVSLDGSTISVEAAVGVVVFISGVVWWLSSKFTKIDDSLTRLKSDMAELKKVLKNCPASKKLDCE